MFFLRYCRTNTFGDFFLRMPLYSVNSKVNQFSKPLYSHKVNIRYDKIKFNLYSTFNEFKCWNCQTILDTRPCLFCKNCSLIQSPEQQNLNYFRLFNIQEKYDIDTGQLTSNFRKLQNLVHPDKFSNTTQEEQLLSKSFSSLLNKAYTTLLNPLLRGLYMLNEHGLSIEEGSITLDTAFLSEIMEWNEEVEGTNTKESLEYLKKNVDVILTNLYKELSKAFIQNDVNQAKVLLSKAKYFSTLLENIKEKDI